jgi:hypothetical protein
MATDLPDDSTAFPRALDVDRVDEWGPVFDPFFADLVSPDVWEMLLKDGRHGSAVGREEELHRMVPDLRPRVAAFLRRHYTHLDMFHGCRITDEASYMTHGLLPSDTVHLQRVAREVFGDTPALQAAIRDLDGRGYRAHNHGKVYLFFARSGALYVGDHYLEGGSEYLRAIAAQIGEGARDRLKVRGRPAIIPCRLSLTELDPSDVEYAAMLPLRLRLTVRDPEAPARFYAVEGGTSLLCAIPPDRLTIEYLAAT